MELQQAQQIAERIVESLKPFCENINIAGSIRRQRDEVKDIEIVLESKSLCKDVFGDPMKGPRRKAFVNRVNELGKILKGSVEEGRYVQIKLHEGINLDLFLPEAYDYYRMFAIRTGSAQYSRKVLAVGWLKRGWVGTEDGLRLKRDCVAVGGGWKCINKDGLRPPVWKSEQEFFEWVNVEWIEPKLRW